MFIITVNNQHYDLFQNIYRSLGQQSPVKHWQMWIGRLNVSVGSVQKKNQRFFGEFTVNVH